MINATGFSKILLTYLYKCNGEFVFVNSGSPAGGGAAVLDYGRIYYSINNGNSWVLVKDNIYGRSTKLTDVVELPAAANNSSQLKIAFEWRNNSSVVNNPPFIIDSLVMKGTASSPIQSASDPANAEEKYLGPYQTVHYYNPVTQRIMATIQNTSAFDFGCTRAELVRTGTGASPAWGLLPGEKISDKVYRVTPANSNPAAPYTITLYFTDAELSGWLNATGNRINDLAIVKSNADLTQLPPAAPAVFSGSNIRSAYGGGMHSLVTSSFTGFSYFAISKPFGNPVCPSTNPYYASDITGTAYQWQVNTGSGYTNIVNGTIYTGTATDTLRLTSPPTNWYGYVYRCAVTTPLGVVYTQAFTLRFGVNWQGTVSTAWENPLNWGCGVVPDANTDVTISAGAGFMPQVNTGTSIRSLKLLPGANVVVKTGVILLVSK